MADDCFSKAQVSITQQMMGSSADDHDVLFAATSLMGETGKCCRVALAIPADSVENHRISSDS